ncbi:hypothetical protein RIVM261_069150 [Rivularia sp. IAM M-261]|nr:hypothetical protein RIVM261_069150 [Rivularia sp. IAM M-261]
MGRIRPEIVQQRIKFFERRFGKAHLFLAYHAAFPLALTPDLLYRLWACSAILMHGIQEHLTPVLIPLRA